MKISYRQDDVPLATRSLFISDLIGYKLNRDLDATKKIKALSGDKGYLSKIVDSARKSPSASGMTIDTVLAGLETALSMEIFSFKVNGLNPFTFINEKLKEEEFTIEVYLNPLFFSSEIALKQALPGFRKTNLTEEFINERMLKASKAWMFGFEKQTKEYFDFSKVKRTILEEP